MNLISLLPENATLALTVSAFTEPGSYYNLENIDSRQARNIERFFEEGGQNEFNIKVLFHISFGDNFSDVMGFTFQ